MSSAILKNSPQQFQEYLKKLFYELFRQEPSLIAAAPGRVNLIGEHTDYNDGYVLPMALDREIYVAAKARTDGRLVMHSVDYNEEVQVPLDNLIFRQKGSWDNYVSAVYWALKKEGYHVLGADLLILGNLPQGTGLSSSAALELAVARAACGLGGWTWDAKAMALLCQRAENEFIGVNCGIMDQFAVAVAEPKSALFLDCRSLAHKSIPVNFKRSEFVIVNSGVKRELQSSHYNDRRRECDEAVRQLAEIKPGLKSLRDADEKLLGLVKTTDAIWFKRARHVVSEDARVLDAILAMEKGDAQAFGSLMVLSHASLRDDYEVSCRELDILVEAAMKVEGCFGARLTGAGFGGCTVNLIERSALGQFTEQVSKAYLSKTGKPAQILSFSAGQPAHLM